MSNEAGHQSNQGSDEKMPWEMEWTLKDKQLATDAVNDVKEVAEGVKMPWEMKWEEKPKFTRPTVPKAPVTPPKKGEYTSLIPTEAAAIKAAQLSPAEKARDAAREKSPGNIAELKAEIAKAKDPKIKKVLEDYLKSLGG